MTPSCLFAAAGVETPEGAAAIDFQSALLLVVLVCLAFMAKTLADMNRRLRDLTEHRSIGAAGAAATAGPLPTSAATAAGAVSPQALAAITAAVYTVFDQPVRIVAVDEVNAEQARTWSLEGRRQIFTSHVVR